jgi:LCP family protein required for cell wall assembly
LRHADAVRTLDGLSCPRTPKVSMPDPLVPEAISHDDGDPYRLSRRPRAGRRRGRIRKRYRVLTVALAMLVTLSLGVGLSALYFVRHLDDNLDVENIGGQLTDRPDKQVADDAPHMPLNILVMGSDSRDGKGDDIDGLTGGGQRSDTTILFHLSADRKSAYGVSIPRDSLVDRPDCTAKNGDTIPGADDVMWNEAFSVGGPACTVEQFEQLTHVYVDNYVVLDFNGFQDMVSAIGGVQVCLPQPVEDPEHGIDIPAGTRTIDGREALNYVRARYTLGDGSDLGRIKRQQAFVAAMAQQVISAGTLTHLNRLVGFLDAATKSLTTDFTSITDIGKVGESFKSIGLGKIRFVTVPWRYSPEDPNRVAWLPSAHRLWPRVAADEPLARTLRTKAITAGDNVNGTGDKDASDRQAAGLCS